MGCCGQGRAEVRTSRQAGRKPVARKEAPDPAYVGGVPLEHGRRSSSTVRGPATGHLYVFTPTAPVQPVHPGDATALLASGLFRPANP